MVHKKILTHLNTAVLLFDCNLKLVFINTAGEVLLDDSAKHLSGLGASKLFKLADLAILNNLQKCLLMNEALIDRELNLYHLKHQTITINFSATPITQNGKVSEILVELQRVDRQLSIKKEEQLFDQQNLSSLLVKGLAHEINNPLGGIRGAAQLLDLELHNPEQQEYAKIIIQESDRLKDLLNKMLCPSKVSKKSSINIHKTLEYVRQLITVESNNNIVIETDYDPSIPIIKADKNQLIQVVLNIMQNSVKAMNNQGKITLKTRILRYITIRRKLYKLTAKLDIIDNGPGIKDSLKEHIFYPMISGRAEGTGLGLSIAQALIIQHDGLIKYKSKPGNTVFSIYLPLKAL